MGAHASKRQWAPHRPLQNRTCAALPSAPLTRLPPELINEITAYLDAADSTQLFSIGNADLTRLLEHGGLTNFALEARSSSLSNHLAPCWSRMASLHHLRHLSIRSVTVQEEYRLTFTPAILDNLPPTLKSFHTDATLNLYQSTIDRFPYCLWGLNELSCAEILVPTRWERTFVLPQALAKLTLRKVTSPIGVLPESLTELHITYDDSWGLPIHSTDIVHISSLPPHLERLTWPFAYGQPFPPLPESLTWLKLGKFALLDAERIPLCEIIPKTLRTLQIDFPVRLEEVGLVSLPQQLEELTVNNVTSEAPELDKEIVQRLPRTLKTLRFWYRSTGDTSIYVQPEAFSALPRNLTRLRLHTAACEPEDIWSKKHQDETALNVNSYLRDLPSTLVELIAFHVLLDVSKLPKTLKSLSCMARSAQLARLPPKLTWLNVHVVHRTKKLAELTFPASLSHLALRVQPCTLKGGVPKFPSQLNTLIWHFEDGNFEDEPSPQNWAFQLPQALFNLELRLPLRMVNEEWVNSLTYCGALPNLRRLELLGHTSLKGNVLSELPTSLSELSLTFDRRIKSKHFSHLPAKLKKLHVHSEFELYLDECVSIVRKLPPSVTNVLLPFDNNPYDSFKEHILDRWANQGIAIDTSLPFLEE